MNTTSLLFVSHSHEDDPFCLRLIADLRANLGDEAVWYDTSGGLHGGDDWWDRIIAEITARPYFLVVLSPNASASKWVPEEMAIAYRQKVELGKHLLPVRLADAPRREDWKGIQEFDFTQASDPARYAAAFAEVLRAVDRKLTTPVISRTPVSPAFAAPERPLSPIERLAQETHTAYAREHWSDVLDKTDILVERGAMTPALWRERASAAFALGNNNGGLAVVKQALQAGVDDADTLLLYTRLTAKAGDDKQAVEILTRAYALVSLNDTATRLIILDELIATLARLRRWDDLAQRVSDARRMAPDDPRWALREIERLLGTGQIDEAIAAVRALPASVDATPLLPAWHEAIAVAADNDIWREGGKNSATRRTLLNAAPSIGADPATITRWRRFDFAHFVRLHSLIHSGRVSDVAWSPDSRLLATTGTDRMAIVWDVATGRKVVSLHSGGGDVGAVAWAPNAVRLAIAKGSTVRLYNTSNWQQTATLSTLTNHVKGLLAKSSDGKGVVLEHVAWSPDGVRLATASSDGTAQVWDVASGRLLAALSDSAPRTHWIRARGCAVVWSPDGARLAILTDSPRGMMIWNAITGQLVTIHSHATADGADIYAVAWSSDGNYLITNALQIWDATSGHLLTDPAPRSRSSSRSGYEYPRMNYSVYGCPHMNKVAWAPDGVRVAVGFGVNVSAVYVKDATTGHDLVAVYDPATIGGQRSDYEPYPQLRAVAWAPDGARLAIATESRVIIWGEE